MLRALSKCILNTGRHATTTTSLGTLFQCLISLLVKKRFLMSSLNLLGCSFEAFLRILSLDTREKRSPPQEAVESNELTPQPPFVPTRQAKLFSQAP